MSGGKFSGFSKTAGAIDAAAERTHAERGAAFGAFLEVNGGLELHTVAGSSMREVRPARINAAGIATEVYVGGDLYIHADHVRADMLPVEVRTAAQIGGEHLRSSLLVHLRALARDLLRDIEGGRYSGRPLDELNIADALIVDALNLIGHDGPATTSETGARYYAESEQ